MKKIISIIVVLVLCCSIALYFVQAIPVNADSDVEILKIYNWEEYISEEDEENGTISTISEFEKYCSETLGRNVIVEYSTFGTNENMYNELNLSKKVENGETVYSYDLVCPSEYMIMKMMREGMLETLDKTQLSTYYSGASPYIQNLFDNLEVDGLSVSDYACCYMWGTLGFAYNPQSVSDEDALDWSLLWNDAYNGTGTIKDSVRDSYVMAIGYVYQDELMDLRIQYKNGELSAEVYNAKITEVFNRTDSETIKLVGDTLTDLKDKIFGYEVDSGKKDMAQGKILINFAWSGDAVYTMDTAQGEYDEIPEEEKLYLNWAVPEAGSNIWFDGWVMPKGANTELALAFIDFISSPEIAKSNMSYIGYTSSIAGDVMYENALDWYGYAGDCFDTTIEGVEITTIDNETTYTYFEESDFTTLLADGETEAYNTLYKTIVNGEETHYYITEDYYVLNDDATAFVLSEEGEEFEVFPVDLSYFFGELSDYSSATIFTDEIGRQFTCQYPDMDTITRCIVMKSFNDSETKILNDMWQAAKIGRIPAVAIILPIALIILLLVGLIVFIKLKNKGLIFQPKAPKGYHLLKIDVL